jgi:hypothetical protein
MTHIASPETRTGEVYRETACFDERAQLVTGLLVSGAVDGALTATLTEAYFRCPVIRLLVDPGRAVLG